MYNGVWEALVDGRVDIAIGATHASPIGDRYSFRGMGFMPWSCVASIDHPLAQISALISDQQLRNYPSLCLEDTFRYLLKRVT